MNIDNLHVIKDHFYTQEIEFIEMEINKDLPENLDEAIKYCEENNITDFIGYNLLILKRDLQKLSDNLDT